MNSILIPILLPMIAAMLCLFYRKKLRTQRLISGATAAFLPVYTIWQLQQIRTDGMKVLDVGLWPDAYGVVLVVDLLSATMLCLSAITQAATMAFLLSGGASEQQERHFLYPLFLLLGAGVHWAFTTADIFNLFVSFEIILISSYVLLAHGNSAEQMRESFKFVIMNIVASTMFLVAAGYTYGIFGTLNMADLALRLAQFGYPPEATILGTMFLVVFGMKAALFPMFYWLPDAYPKAPLGIVAYFAGILTKVGVYALYRMFCLVFNDPSMMTDWFQPIILAIGGATMLVGVLCALSQWTMRRILSFHIISQIGYMIFALGLFTPVAIGFGIFYIIHHIIVKASLFLVADSVKINEGSEELKKVQGLSAVYPALAMWFLFASLSLAGIPPLSGFYGKYGLVIEGIAQEQYFYVTVSLLTSLFTIASMIKIWRYVFWRDYTRKPLLQKINRRVIGATGALVSVSILVAILSGFIMSLAVDAAEQAMTPSVYIEAVLGEKGSAAYAQATTAEVAKR